MFCGSQLGGDEGYKKAAKELGRMLGEKGIRLVFGGGSVGLMGVVADAAMEVGGEVVGVIPEALNKVEVAHMGLSKLHVVGSMHERKALMAELSKGFIALPGGLGTLEELFEVLTWSQLNIHQKRCVVLDVGGYYGHIRTFLDHAVREGFVREQYRGLVDFAEGAEEALEKLGRGDWDGGAGGPWPAPEI